MSRRILNAFLFALGAITAAIPEASAAGEILITQAKALAGNVTPGDSPGFPVTLSLPGSYALASNLIPGPGKIGIVAAAPDIAIDLSGFTMSGGPSGGLIIPGLESRGWPTG